MCKHASRIPEWFINYSVNSLVIHYENCLYLRFNEVDIFPPPLFIEPILHPAYAPWLGTLSKLFYHLLYSLVQSRIQ